MAGLSSITVDLARGEIVLGRHRVVLTPERDPVAAAAPSRFRLDDGGCVRLIGFGERSRLVRDALADASPAGALVTQLRAAAYEGPRGVVADAVLLAIAGGAEDAPEFDICAVEVSRLQDWSWLSLHDAPAILVDRATAQRPTRSDATEWTRFVFSGPNTCGLDSLVDEMVASLLARGVPPKRSRNARRQDVAASSEAPATRRLGPVASANRSASEPSSGDPAAAPLSASAPSGWPAPYISNAPPLPNQRPVAAHARTAVGGAAPAAASVTAPLTNAPAAAYPAPLRIHRSRQAPAAGPAVAPVSPLSSPVPQAARRARSPGRVTAQAMPGAATQAPRQPPITAAVPVALRSSVAAIHSTPPMRDPRAEFARSRAEMPASAPVAHTRSAALAAPAPRRRLAATADALGQIARALADECDLRGLEA